MHKHYSVLLSGCRGVKSCPRALYAEAGGLAQMVERPLSMLFWKLQFYNITRTEKSNQNIKTK